MRRAFALLLAGLATAQEPRFDTQSRLVLVPATVSGAKGRPVDGLVASDFLILDNGRPQKPDVDTFATGVAKIALVIAVQSSGISAAVLAKVQKIGGMIQPLVTGDRGCAGLVAFSGRVEWLQECTTGDGALRAAFQKLRPGEPTSARMLDAAHESIDHLSRSPNALRVLLLISESRDRGSETDLNSALISAQAAGVTVYAATYSAFKTAFTTKPSGNRPRLENDPVPGRDHVPMPSADQRVDILGGIGELVRLGKTNTTQILTRATGGTILPFTRQKGLEEAIEKLGAELHTQYVLSFAPEPRTAGYHQLEVSVPRRAGTHVRARKGYWSGGANSPAQ